MDDKFATSLGHDLVNLIEKVSVVDSVLMPWREDKQFLMLLSKAEQEGRYPLPITESIYGHHGIAAVYTDGNYRKAFSLSRALFEQLEASSGWVFPLEGLRDPSISVEDWDRFIRILK